jgi:hypothetical protein
MGYGRTDGWWREGMAAGVVVSTGSGSFRLMGKKRGGLYAFILFLRSSSLLSVLSLYVHIHPSIRQSPYIHTSADIFLYVRCLSDYLFIL